MQHTSSTLTTHIHAKTNFRKKKKDKQTNKPKGSREENGAEAVKHNGVSDTAR
jgi:hypothetical protein